LNEQVFALTYLVPGMTYQSLEGMTRQDRVWFVKRLAEQKKLEEEEIKRVQHKHREPRRKK